ncbi:MAG: Gfo/Idh/MocA family oxidoreductase [Elusimicrobia bacterium]|jgi:predicted dehydrogenase|nr:Gfo/Idh/MocA family oxidoreductase [Elusimicrobiota bacterium]
MSDKIKAAVIGTGHLGRHHVRVLSELSGVELVGVADLDYGSAKKHAKKYGSKAYKDYRELVGKVNAVSIVTPTETHHRIARDFLKAGCNTFVEKPITNRPEHASELIDTAEKSSAILQVGHIERYNAAVTKVREYVKTPKFIEVNRLSKFPDRSMDIGVVLDLMIHDIDIILSFVNSPVAEIESVGTPVFSEDKEDIANCRLKFKNGCIANITASRISYKSERKFRVFQEDAYISLDYEKQDFVIYTKKRKKVTSPKDVKRIKPKVEKKEPLKAELKDFISCVREGRQPEVTGHQGLTALKLALEITDKI